MKRIHNSITRQPYDTLLAIAHATLKEIALTLR